MVLPAHTSRAQYISSVQVCLGSERSRSFSSHFCANGESWDTIKHDSSASSPERVEHSAGDVGDTVNENDDCSGMGDAFRRLLLPGVRQGVGGW
jgi:hypothetical protein